MNKKHPLSKVKIFFIFTLFSLFYNISDVFGLEILDIDIYIKNHRFEPEIIKIPENTKIGLNVYNMDETAEEFDSNDLKREKIIPGGSKARIIIAPLRAGRYEFIGEFHPDTAKGVVIVE